MGINGPLQTAGRLIGQRDRVDMSAVIRFCPVGGAAVGIELRRVGIGAKAEVLDGRDLGPAQSGNHVAGQVEHRVARTARRLEEADRVGLDRDETVHQVLADLVVRLADHRAGGGHDAPTLSAELCHRRDRRLDDPGECAAPSGVSGADHPRAGSASSTGPQSAVETPMARPGTRVTMASARGRSLAGHDVSATTTVGEWIW